jgi:hypothetical protein
MAKRSTVSVPAASTSAVSKETPAAPPGAAKPLPAPKSKSRQTLLPLGLGGKKTSSTRIETPAPINETELPVVYCRSTFFFPSLRFSGQATPLTLVCLLQSRAVATLVPMRRRASCTARSSWKS